jgi:hypothetical protein
MNNFEDGFAEDTKNQGIITQCLDQEKRRSE